MNANKISRRVLLATIATTAVSASISSAQSAGIPIMWKETPATDDDFLRTTDTGGLGVLVRYTDPDARFTVLRPEPWAQDRMFQLRTLKTVSSEKNSSTSETGNTTTTTRQNQPDSGIAFQRTSDPTENLSILVTPVGPFPPSLQAFGSPDDFAKRLAESIRNNSRGAPKVVQIKKAYQRTEDENIDEKGEKKSTKLYYIVEYEVISPTWDRRNISVMTIYNGLLYTLNIQTPQQRWRASQNQLRDIALSFNVF